MGGTRRTASKSQALASSAGLGRGLDASLARRERVDWPAVHGTVLRAPTEVVASLAQGLTRQRGLGSDGALHPDFMPEILGVKDADGVAESPTFWIAVLDTALSCVCKQWQDAVVVFACHSVCWSCADALLDTVRTVPAG